MSYVIPLFSKQRRPMESHLFIGNNDFIQRNPIVFQQDFTTLNFHGTSHLHLVKEEWGVCF